MGKMGEAEVGIKRAAEALCLIQAMGYDNAKAYVSKFRDAELLMQVIISRHLLASPAGGPLLDAEAAAALTKELGEAGLLE